MNDRNRLLQQLEFSLELDKEKQIGRQTYIADGSRKENDAEHAWHMAVMAILLSEYSNEPIDLLKTLKMILLHDVVEIDAGDTYAYDEEAKKSQGEREEKAANRLYGLLPVDQRDELKELWKEFESLSSPEAKFAKTMDNIQPIMLNNANNGIGWVEHDVHIDQIMKRQIPTPKGSEFLWEYVKENWLEPHVEKGIIKK